MINSGELNGTPSPSGIPTVVDYISAKGPGPRSDELQAEGLADLAPALLGLSDSDHSLPRHAGRRRFRKRTFRCCCLRSRISSRKAALRWRTMKIHANDMSRSAAARQNAIRTPWTRSCVRAGISTGISIRRTLRSPGTKRRRRKWLPVDIYIGGAEHACMHLLYFRFIAKVLVRCRMDSRRRTRGASLPSRHGLRRKGRHHVEVERATRSRPSDIMDQWGVDVCRLAMFFFAPSNIDIKWKEDGLAGAHRLVLRLWNLFERRGAEGARALPERERPTSRCGSRRTSCSPA